MHKLMCTFMTPMKKKIPDRNLDTSCPAGIPCNKFKKKKKIASRSVFGISPLIRELKHRRRNERTTTAGSRILTFGRTAHVFV